uniref:DUF6699 domain-containing protein n=1 Tax=Moniliophthora roreri TaxID=221103 RepID=A0A0W0F4F0_MONRR
MQDLHTSKRTTPPLFLPGTSQTSLSLAKGTKVFQPIPDDMFPYNQSPNFKGNNNVVNWSPAPTPSVSSIRFRDEEETIHTGFQTTHSPPSAYPYPLQSLPPVSYTSASALSATISPFLQYQSQYCISWNLRSNQRNLPQKYSNTPAVEPKVSVLKISIKHFPWVIEVYAGGLGYVTVEDVLTGVFRKLGEVITSLEFEQSTQNHPGGKQAVQRAFADRCNQLNGVNPAAARTEFTSGLIRRVDYLAGYEFKGLLIRKESPLSIELRV